MEKKNHNNTVDVYVKPEIDVIDIQTEGSILQNTGVEFGDPDKWS